MADSNGLDRVADEVAARQRVAPALFIIDQTIAYADGAELDGSAARGINAGGNRFGELIEMGMTGNGVGKAVCDTDERTLNILTYKAAGFKQAAHTYSVAAFLHVSAYVTFHCVSPLFLWCLYFSRGGAALRRSDILFIRQSSLPLRRG